MSATQEAATERFTLSPSTLLPEEVTGDGLPLTLRGYDREYVDRLLARVADAYASTLAQNDSLRARLRSLAVDLAAAEGEAAASAHTVAELMRSVGLPAGQVPPTREALRELEAKLENSEQEREQALAGLREVSARAAKLVRQLETTEGENPAATQSLMADLESRLPDTA